MVESAAPMKRFWNINNVDEVRLTDNISRPAVLQDIFGTIDSLYDEETQGWPQTGGRPAALEPDPNFDWDAYERENAPMAIEDRAEEMERLRKIGAQAVQDDTAGYRTLVVEDQVVRDQVIRYDEV